MSLKGMANHLAESCRYKEEGWFMPSGGGGGGGGGGGMQPLHANLRSLTFVDVDYICTMYPYI